MLYVTFNFIAGQNILVIWFKINYLPLLLCIHNINTVKPVLRDHLLDKEKVVF